MIRGTNTTDPNPVRAALEYALAAFGLNEEVRIANDASDVDGWDQGLTLGPTIEFLTSGIRMMSGVKGEDLAFVR